MARAAQPRQVGRGDRGPGRALRGPHARRGVHAGRDPGLPAAAQVQPGGRARGRGRVDGGAAGGEEGAEDGRVEKWVR